MAVRASRPRPLLQDENAQHKIVSGGAPANKGLGSKPQQNHHHHHHQQQAPLLERKKLSNITNQVHHPLSVKGNVGTENGKAPSSVSFSIKADTDLGLSKQGLQDLSSKPSSGSGLQEGSVKVTPTPRVPLKNISNGGSVAQRQNQENAKPLSAKLKPKVGQPVKPSSTSFLTEEMKKKAALWAEEGIERVHFSGEEMEALRQKLQDEEIAKRVALAVGCRTELPFPRFRPVCDISWKPCEVLELDFLEDFPDDADFGHWRTTSELDRRCLDYTDYFLSGCSPPKFPEGWPKVKDEDADQVF